MTWEISWLYLLAAMSVGGMVYVLLGAIVDSWMRSRAQQEFEDECRALRERGGFGWPEHAQPGMNIEETDR